MNIAIIPARGGSKRIPKKNIKLFAGKPIIAYSIEIAKKAELFDRIIVSTDSDEIAGISKKYGAEIPFKRPDELANDITGTDEVMLHALNWLNSIGEIYEHACCIYATAPFLQSKYLKEGFGKLKEEKVTSAFTVTTFSSPIYRALKINKKNRLEMIWPEYYESRSQDLSEVYHDAGQFYWVNVEKYLEEGIIWSEDAVPIFLPRYLVHDIDTLEDWKIAEYTFKALNQGL